MFESVMIKKKGGLGMKAESTADFIYQSQPSYPNCTTFNESEH